MTISVQNLSTLDPTMVANFDATLTSQLIALNPALALNSGLLHDLLLHYKAILDAATQTNINLITQSNSLLQVNANPNLADPSIVAALLSNYNITASQGTDATGSVTIMISQLAATVIPASTIFTISGLSFTPVQTTAGRTSSASVVTSSDVLITTGPIIGGVQQYVFNVPVVASAVGAAGNVGQGATATLSNNPPFFTQAYAASGFTGGTDPDTNQTLLAKLAAGGAVQAWSNRVSINGLIRSQFPTILNISIIGFQDSEMLRDQHAIWPGSLGGHSDLYLQSQPIYNMKTLAYTATLVSKTGSVGTWQIGVGREDVPGFYRVSKILLPSQAATAVGFTVTSDVRSLDLTTPLNPALAPVPDLVSSKPNEGVYSRYQAAVIQFQDNVTDATALVIGTATQSYNITFEVMPLVASVQDYLLQRTIRPPMCDVLVKAPIPCFTTMAITINYNSTTTAPVAATIQNAIASAVNALGFVGTLSAVFVQKLLYATVSNIVSIGNLTMTGTIRNPDGSTTTINSSPDLTIANNYPLMVSGRTTLFFVQPTDITVTLVSTVVPNV